MVYLLVLLVLAVVLYAISAPFRAAAAGGTPVAETVEATALGPDPVAELTAARDAKYREIRDAELDVRTGKLSQEDYDELNGTLRGEAIEILRQLDDAEGADSRELDAAEGANSPEHKDAQRANVRELDDPQREH